MKRPIAVGFICLFLSNFSMANAVKNYVEGAACETYLCLGGAVLTGEGVKTCLPAMRKFFDIRFYSQRGFEPQITQGLRAVYLESCKTSDKKLARAVLLKFGDQEYLNIPTSNF
ncbi:hypothetical protein [Neisseria sp. Ec49-e6-T10]|uniref:hypothetical protein n=1 Tax=Neisseria sp. Ec49-e6-T10 TaxID=3140744 RepID=UPI003EB74824